MDVFATKNPTVLLSLYEIRGKVSLVLDFSGWDMCEAETTVAVTSTVSIRRR